MSTADYVALAPVWIDRLATLTTDVSRLLLFQITNLVRFEMSESSRGSFRVAVRAR